MKAAVRLDSRIIPFSLMEHIPGASHKGQNISLEMLRVPAECGEAHHSASPAQSGVYEARELGAAHRLAESCLMLRVLSQHLLGRRRRSEILSDITGSPLHYPLVRYGPS